MARNYPMAGSHFQVDWGGTSISFATVSGLRITHEIVEYRGGADPEYSNMKMPIATKYSDITLKRGICQGDNEFFHWMNTVALNTIERRDITISLLNESHEPVVVWKVKSAFPKEVAYGDLDAMNATFAIEELLITHEGMTVQND
ncbi:MAG: phage tail protein [Bacteroidota bacterium]